MKESGEMYLESIFELSKTKSAVRAVDVADYMGYSRPSVSRAMGLLRKDGLILTDEGGNITLTHEGQRLAERIAERHRVLTDMLLALGISAETAAADACRIEHIISDESFEAIKAHQRLHRS